MTFSMGNPDNKLNQFANGTGKRHDQGAGDVGGRCQGAQVLAMEVPACRAQIRESRSKVNQDLWGP